MRRLNVRMHFEASNFGGSNFGGSLFEGSSSESSFPTMLDDFERMIVFILDLETTGVDIGKDPIVEIAAVHAHGDIQMNCEISRRLYELILRF